MAHRAATSIPDTMTAAVVHAPGGPEVLQLEQVPVPHVRPGWSLVRIAGFGINHSEIFTRNGLSPSVRFPRILGIECVGRVAATSDPKRLPVGQVVTSLMGEMGRAFDGSYAQYALIPNGQIYPLPHDAVAGLSWAQLAAIPETFFTAFGSMETLAIDGHDDVLVRAGSSAAGIAFMRLLRARFPQMHIVATVRKASESKRDALLRQGFSDVLLDDNGVLEGTDTRFTKALELIGPATLRDTIAHLAPFATVCSTGQLGGVWTLDDFDPIMELRHGVRLTGFYSGDVDDAAVRRMFTYIRDWHVPSDPAQVFTLDQIVQAHEYVDQAHGFGKTVVLNESALNDPLGEAIEA